MRLLVMLLLGLHLATELCRGNEGDMGSSESGGFSCGGCTVGTMYHPFYCQHCYRATGGDDEEYSCKRCKFGPSKSKRFICDECTNTDQKTTTITPQPKLECCNNFIIYNKELKIHYVFHYYEPSNGFPVYKEKCKERDPLIEHVFPKCKKEELYFHFIGGRWVELRSRRQDRVYLDGKVVREYPKFGPPACPEKTLPLLPNALRGEPVAQCCYTDFCYILSKHT